MTAATASAIPGRAPPARGVSRAKWIVAESPAAGVLAPLMAELQLPESVCRLLAIRGQGSPEDARRFLRPRLEHLHPPDSMMGLPRAVERLARAIHDDELIFVHGDYDVDGVCSTTLLTRVLRALGGRVVPFIPRRLEDGYDLGDAGVTAALAAGARVVVTCDCGTCAYEPIARLTAAGVDVIVTDHHLPAGAVPSCYAVLNPKQPGCEYPDDDLAAVGVAFKLALGLTQFLGRSEGIVYGLLDLVALATIADLAPLRGENRIFARLGLRVMAETRLPGLRALIRAAALDGKVLTAGRVGFILAPRINAMGRLGHAMRAVDLFLTDDEHEAFTIAREMEEMNRRRQEVDRATLGEARAMVADMDLETTRGIVLARRGWHAGVIGIVASRIVEDTCRPAVLIAVDGDQGKGSGRSVGGFDLHAGLTRCRDLLVRFGGHRAAAGVTIEASRIPDFTRRFDDVARETLATDDLTPSLRVDLELPIEGASEEFEALLRHFEPYGLGNPGPVLLVRGVRVATRPTRVGADGMKCRLRAGEATLDAIGWGMASRAEELRADLPLDLVFRLERDEWQGASRLQARLLDFRG